MISNEGTLSRFLLNSETKCSEIPQRLKNTLVLMEYIMRKKTVVVVTLLGVVFAFGVVRLSLRKTLDTSVHSGNIEATIKPDLNYPYLGIWKTHPTDNFGVIIDKVSDGEYSVSYFGPGGRFRPGTWMPNTTLVNDSSYRIIDKDVIEINKVFEFIRYYRVSDDQQVDNQASKY